MVGSMVVEDVIADTTTVEERAWGYKDYVEALEEERRKIQVFQRELPLSLRLVTQSEDLFPYRLESSFFLNDGGKF